MYLNVIKVLDSPTLVNMSVNKDSLINYCMACHHKVILLQLMGPEVRHIIFVKEPSTKSAMYNVKMFTDCLQDFEAYEESNASATPPSNKRSLVLYNAARGRDDHTKGNILDQVATGRVYALTSKNPNFAAVEK